MFSCPVYMVPSANAPASPAVLFPRAAPHQAPAAPQAPAHHPLPWSVPVATSVTSRVCSGGNPQAGAPLSRSEVGNHAARPGKCSSFLRAPPTSQNAEDPSHLIFP